MSLNRLTLVLLGASLSVCVSFSPRISIQAQQVKAKWERVYTGEDSLIDVNVSSVRLEPSRILRVQFRTILSKPENLKGRPAAKYKSRLETIDFKLNENRYRLFETSLLDANGKRLQSYTASGVEDWRVLRAGGVMDRLFNAARSLPPFGTWKAVAYRFPDGSPNGSTATPELSKLIGTRVRLQSDRAEVGAKVCLSPSFQDKRATREDLFRALGIQLEAIGINAENAAAINVKCEGSGWSPPQSLLLKVSNDEMLMLWDGVFLVLRTERRWTGALLPSLKRVPR